MTCKNEQYDEVCKDEFAGLHKKLDQMDEAIRGNGKPGIQTRLDRLEQDKLSRSKVVWFVIGRDDAGRFDYHNTDFEVDMKLALEIADAMVAELNGGTFSESITAARRVLPEYELAELKPLMVTVVPKSVAIANVTRQSSSYEVVIDIGIQQKIGKDTDDEVLRLSGIVSEMVAFLNRRVLAGLPAARFKTLANEPVYAPEMLSEKRLFLSVVTVTYVVVE